MNNSDVVIAYSKIAKRYAQLFLSELDNKPLDRKIYDLFSERVPKNEHSIEIGCGPGEISIYLKKKGLDIIGIDKSEEMILCAKKASQQVRFFVQDVFQLPYKDNSFFGIVAPYLIVNFTKKEILTAFKEIYRIQKTSGIFLFSFHTGNNNRLHTRDFLIKNNPIVFYLYDKSKIVNLLKNAGYEPLEIIEKSPYPGEKTTRAYIFARKI